jgi:hypothetical protein
MKRSIQSGQLSRTHATPLPQPLPTGGRGGTRFAQGNTCHKRAITPSPHCGGGLGWGGLPQG